MSTRGRVWAGLLLLGVLSQFAGPLSGVASAFVGPVWLPVSQTEAAAEQPEPGPDAGEAPEAGAQPAEEPGGPGMAAAEDGCAEAGAPIAGCVTDFADCVQAPGADPAVCAGDAAADVQQEASQLTPSGEPPCSETPELACVLAEVREQACPEDTEAPQCTAIDLVVECLDAEACVAEHVVAPVAAGVCDALGDEPEPAEGEEAEPACAERLQTCQHPDSPACREALEYLGQRVEQAACETEPVDCAPVEQLRRLLACEDKAGCAFLALWDEATPVVCENVAGSDTEQCADTLDGCDMPGTPGCETAAEYLAEQLEATACAEQDLVCAARTVLEACVGNVESPEPAPVACADGAEAAVLNAVCALDVVGEDCPPPPVPALRACLTWNGTEPELDPRCARDVVIAAACAGQADCVLQKGPVAELIAAGEDCAAAGTTTAACAEGLRQVALGALCAQPQTCIEGMAKCPDVNATTCQAEAVWDEVCAEGSTSCPPELKALRVCIGAPATCATQPFLQKWISDACLRQTSASAACPVGVLVRPPARFATPDGGTVSEPAVFENGSTAFPYLSIARAISALSRGAGGAVAGVHAGGMPTLKGPITVNAGAYTETATISVPSFPAGVDSSIVGTGVASLASTGTALTLPPGHRLAIKRTLKLAGSPAIAGPKATTTVTIDRSRMYVGHGAGVDLTYANTDVAVPEQVLAKLTLEGPGVSKDAVRVQTWNGTAWTNLTLTDNGSSVQATVHTSDPAAVPSLVSGSAGVRVVASTPMGITITGQLVGAMTEVVYASHTLPSIEVAEVPDAPVPPVGTPRTEADDAPPTVRLSGEDRAATAAAVSRSAFPDGADAVFVATGASYADALAGGPAAAKSGSPVVLVERDRIPEATRDELTRLAPQQVLLLGGTGAISAEIEEELAAMGADVSRLRGDSRYATAAAVSAAHFAPGVPVVYIASGEGFADALSGGAAAAALGAPVLLVQPDAVPAATDQELRRLAPGRMVVLGGRQAVSESVEAQLRAHGADVRRVSGATRYATSAAVSRDAFAGSHETVFVVTGATFPDALAGVPAAGALKAPLMLVETDRLPPEVAAELDRLRPKRIVILGGQNSVSQRLERELRSYQVP